MKVFKYLTPFLLFLLFISPVQAENMSDKLKGRILLQVEKHGEAWYVHPDTGLRYYMKDGATAYEMMRAFGLGITDVDLASLQAGDEALIDQLRGRIVLQVERHGEAWYVHPEDGSTHYLRDGAAAYRIMRELSLGILDRDLDLVISDEFRTIEELRGEFASAPAPSVLGASTDESGTSYVGRPIPRVAGISTEAPKEIIEAPEGIDIDELNDYWLKLVNDERARRGVRLLILDNRFRVTATDYAFYMHEAQAFDHSRADGSSMHDWIKEQNIDFSIRGSEGGWNRNFFTENIAWGNVRGDMESIKRYLDQSFEQMMAEEVYDGVHFRTIIHEDWNTVGIGFYFHPIGENRYKAHTAMHYGSLSL